jgi:hypothetical protein
MQSSGHAACHSRNVCQMLDGCYLIDRLSAAGRLSGGVLVRERGRLNSAETKQEKELESNTRKHVRTIMPFLTHDLKRGG